MEYDKVLPLAEKLGWHLLRLVASVSKLLEAYGAKKSDPHDIEIVCHSRSTITTPDIRMSSLSNHFWMQSWLR